MKNIAVNERNIVRELRASGIDEKSTKYLEARKILIQEELKYQNIQNGYWVACIDPFAACNAIHGRVDIQSDDDITVIALSDGLERLVSNFKVYDNVCQIADDLLLHGDEYVFSKLRKLEKDKNNFYKPISSAHDDASYVVLTNR